MSATSDELSAAARVAPHLRLLVLHGSQARGTAHERSDWDFAYLGDDGLDADGLLTALIDISRTDHVDALDLARAGALIRHRVARDGVLVYEATTGLFERFRLEAIHQWCDLEPVLTPIYERALRALEQER
jgi:predicted nucleotidyltransferase